MSKILLNQASQENFSSNSFSTNRVSGHQVAQLFDRVDAQLRAHEPLWRMQPFELVCAQGASQHILGLDSAIRLLGLDALSLNEIEALDANATAQVECFGDSFPEVFAFPWLLGLQENRKQVLPSFPFWLTNGISGRKLAQIRYFIAQLPPLQGKLLEWCAGKGHLGRLLVAQSPSLSPLYVTSVEWQQGLCEAGAELAKKHQLTQQFQHLDVLSTAGQAVLAEHEHVVALHACGDLHLSLLRNTVPHGNASIYLVPCCYHLIADKQYQPLSNHARQSPLQLSRDDLKLAVQGQVTAGARVAKLRQTEVTWRLAYQVLRERYAQAEGYRPLASVPKHWFAGAFADFADWAAQQHDWLLPTEADLSSALEEGAQRYLEVKRLDLIRHIFRRPLELWLLADRALYLQEQGYQVSLKAFCSYQVTPRNVLLQATPGRAGSACRSPIA